MGVFLKFKLASNRISQDQWEEVYQEALQIAAHSDLMDRIVTARSGERFAFAKKTEERELSGNRRGIYACGTMSSGCDMEDFYLYRELEYYRIRQEDNGADILFCDWYPEDPEIPEPTGVSEVWGNKTQGRPGHILLLAIACLFADRFPHAVKVAGDITAGQCRAAVRLANQYLERPIQTPVTCRADALAQRLQKAPISVQKQMEAFFELYRGTLTPEVREVLCQTFTWEELYCHFRDQLAQQSLGDYSFHTLLRNYMLLDLDFSGLLRMLVSDPEGSCLPLEKILAELFACRVHVPLEEKNCINITAGNDAAIDGDDEEPHEIDAVMGRLFFMMAAGRNRTLPVYLPLETIRETCRPLAEDAGALIDRLLEEQTPDEAQERAYGNGEDSAINMLQKKSEVLRAEYEARHQYDIGDPEDLYSYHPGCTIYPDLENELISCFRKIREFDVEEDYLAFLSLDRAGREAVLIRKNRYILIREEVWEHIFAHIMDDTYVYRYFLLFCVDCSNKAVYDVMAPLLSSPALIDGLWEKAAAETEQH